MKTRFIIAITYLVITFGLALSVKAENKSLGLGSPNTSYAKKFKRAQKKYIKSQRKKKRPCEK